MDRKHRILPGTPGILDLATKTMHVELKADGSGRFSAVIATLASTVVPSAAWLDVVDRDGDVTLPGAFAGNDDIAISAWGHATWGSAPPVGKGRIRETATEAIVDGEFFMGTVDGRETHELVRQMGAMQRWSYGYDPLESEPTTIGGRTVRILRRLKVYEASPVLVAAGIGTRTLDIAPKSALPLDLVDIRAQYVGRNELARSRALLVRRQRTPA